MIVVALLWLIPFLWLISTSLKPEGQILSLPIRWIPKTITLENYIAFSTKNPAIRWMFNSLIVASLTTIFCLIIDSLTAYALSKMEFKGKSIVFGLVISTLLFPIHVTVVPLFLGFAKIHLLNTYLALILPATANGFGIFLLRQFFISIPNEIIDAAKIDGCSSFKILTKIILPLSKPALTSAGIFIFIWSWNDFLWPLIATNSKLSMTLPVALANFMSGSQVMGQVPRYGESMAGAFFATIPAVLIFIFLQRHFIRGITTSGLKG